MDLSTIIVSYNTFDLTRRAVETVLASGDEGAVGARRGVEHEVIIVDNGSPDASAARLRAAFADDSRVVVLERPDNPGFAVACNHGAQRARGRHLFFLNPDTETHGDTVPALVDFLDAHPQTGAVGPWVTNADGTDQGTIETAPSASRLVAYYLPIVDAVRGRDRRTDAVPVRSGPVDLVNGCALAVSRRAFEAVGGWDERYFMYFEDNDLCLRLLHAGYPSHYLREAHVTHLQGAASGARHVSQMLEVHRSMVRYYRQHAPRLVPLNRALGLGGYGLRRIVFSILAHRARADAERADAYRLRADAAAALWRWYLRGDA